MSHFTIFTDANGEFRWRFQANNNTTIADSGEGYKSLNDCKHGIELIKRDAAAAEIVEQEPAKV